MMKYKMISILTVTVFLLGRNVSCFSLEYEIWGVWNLGQKEYADKKARLSIGTFLKTDDYLYFEPNYYDSGPIISYEGGYYAIKEIIKIDKNKIALILDHEQTIREGDGKLVTDTVRGKVLMHFIDNNHMWLELDYNDSEYPTDKQFDTTDFKGQTVVFWRAEKVEEL